MFPGLIWFLPSRESSETLSGDSGFEFFLGLSVSFVSEALRLIRSMKLCLFPKLSRFFWKNTSACLVLPEDGFLLCLLNFAGENRSSVPMLLVMLIAPLLWLEIESLMLSPLLKELDRLFVFMLCLA